MKIEHILLAVSTLAFGAAAQAGQIGAGPGGTGSQVVGSVISADSASEAAYNSHSPGLIGSVILSGDQVNLLAASLKSQSGTTVNGNLIIAPTVFADSTNGTVTLNTDTGVLTLTRV